MKSANPVASGRPEVARSDGRTPMEFQPTPAEPREPVHEGGPSLKPSVLAELFRESEAERLGLTLQQFEAILRKIAAKYLPSTAKVAEATDFCRKLRLADLALARACAAGNEQAWTLFLTRYREDLYRSAWAIARDESARELADSVYAELYGLEVRDGSRISKLDYYDGRGSLEGWLRSVLAHEYANRLRSGRRLISLDEQVEGGREFRAPQPQDPAVPVDPRLEAAADEALSALSPEERFLLASYYLDRQTLAEIAATLGVHESTVSRKLDRTTQALSKRIIKELRRRGMSRDQAREAMEADVRDLAVDVRRHLARSSARNEPGNVP